MKAWLKKIDILLVVAFCFVANCFFLLDRSLLWLLLVLPLFLAVNLFAGVFAGKARGLRLRVCYHGGMLLLTFAISMNISLIFHTVMAYIWLPDAWRTLLWSAVFSVIAPLSSAAAAVRILKVEPGS